MPAAGCCEGIVGGTLSRDRPVSMIRARNSFPAMNGLIASTKNTTATASQAAIQTTDKRDGDSMPSEFGGS